MEKGAYKPKVEKFLAEHKQRSRLHPNSHISPGWYTYAIRAAKEGTALEDTTIYLPPEIIEMIFSFLKMDYVTLDWIFSSTKQSWANRGRLRTCCDDGPCGKTHRYHFVHVRRLKHCWYCKSQLKNALGSMGIPYCDTIGRFLVGDERTKLLQEHYRQHSICWIDARDKENGITSNHEYWKYLKISNCPPSDTHLIKFPIP